MASKNKDLFLGRMSSICADQSSLTARIAMISLFSDSSVPVLFHKILLLLEYLQLLSPILLFTLFFNQTQHSFFPKTVLFLARFINPGLWLPFDDLNDAEIIILSGLFILTVLKYLLLIWIIYKFVHNSQPQKLLAKLWRNLFEVQGRVLYFYTTFFWVNMAMTTSLTESLNEERESKGKLVSGLLAISLDFAFSLILYSRYHYMLPSKSFLSSKDNIVDMITLVQKLVVQILTIFLPLDSQSSMWVVTIVNVTIDLIRNFYFFRRLPLYSFEALNYQAIILMVISSANLASLACVVGKSIDPDTISLHLFVYIWVIMFLLTVKISREYLKMMFWEIICNTSLKSPGLLVHRVTAIKELGGLAEENFGSNDNYLWGSLVNRSLNTNLVNILKLPADDKELDINDKKSAQMILKGYLERLLEKYPQNSYVQLYATQYFMKKFHKYGDGVKTTQTLIKMNSSINVKLNAELLLIQIQNQLREKAAERDRQSQIDPTSYLQEQSLFFQLQTSMLEQAQAQIKVCTEMKKDCPDTNLIHESSQIFNHFRKKNLKRIKNLLENLSETNLEPLLLYAHYSLSLNHCSEDYSRYLKIYSQRLQKYQKYFDQEDLCKKNIFQNNTGLYLLSGNKANAGHIMFAPRALGTRSGTQSDALNDATITSRIAPCLRTVHALFYKNAAEHNDETYFNKAIRGYIYHQDGYLMEVTYHLNIHPYVTQGFYFVLFLRPIISTRETIYLLENGDIDCGTKNISERLGLLNINSKSSKNIKNISEELETANKAFNMISFPQKYPPIEELTMEEAKKIYDEYSTVGKNILLSPLEQEENCEDPIQYSYRCQMVNKTFGPKVIKALLLEENIKENLQNMNLRTYERLKTKRQKTVTTDRKYRTPTEKDLKIPTEKDFDTQPFEDDDEKEEGWINFEPLTCRRIQPNLFKSEEDEDLSSRLTSAAAVPLMESERKPFFLFDSPKVITRKKTFRMKDRPSQEVDRHSHKASSLNESHSKGASQRKRLEHAFQAALEYKHYPSVFKGLACLVYGMLFAFMLSQFLIVQIFYDNLDNFQGQKDILRDFQLRNYYLIATQGLSRLIYDVQTGGLNTTGMRTFAGGLNVYRTLAMKNLVNLTETNQDLLLNAKLFDAKVSDLLFAKDIPIYYTYFDESPQVYEDQTSFIAVDQIITSIMSVIRYNGTDPDGIIETAHFVFRNALNDLLVKNQAVSDTIIGFLNEQRESIHQYITHAFVIELVVVFIVLMVFIVALWRQHKKEANKLTAFCRIYGRKVEKILQGFVEFKEMIEDQKSLSSELTKLSNKESQTRIIEGPAKREALKKLNHKGLHRKYYVYVGIFVVLLVILAAFMIVSAVQTFSLLNAFKDEQEQIYFVDYMRVRIQLIVNTARELLITNNTVDIENKPALDEVIYLLDELKQVKSEIYDKLLDEKTLEKIPSVKTMLLDDPCGMIGLPEAGFYCQILSNMGVEKGLVYLLGDYEEYLIDILNDYEISDKSDSARTAILKNLYNMLPPFIFVLVNGALSLSDMIDGQLEKQLEASKENRSLFLVGCFTIIIGTGCLTWIFILRKLKESVSQFKNALKVLPADIILSSFILKNFLNKTSKGSTFSSFQK